MASAESLDSKVERTVELMKDVLNKHDPHKIAVAWTGGKDSTVVMAIWIEVLKMESLKMNPRALSIDTGVKFPEVLSFRDSLASDWNIDVDIVRPDIDPDAYPYAVDVLKCCRELKVEPLMKAVEKGKIEVLISGIRRDEHPSRQNRDYLEKREAPEHLMLNPVLDWTEMDIWSFITMNDLPFCELYDQGYRSLGCRPCTAKSDAGGEREGRNSAKEQKLELLTSLGYF
ncbi:phosphoadenosine phosphosulfate reductase family protein [Maridesulfovibrio bastinii]|uniref:phosphoadenosine phosphosulfate reductase family protein n=1 Tax=Maridesulfovibrio bastinii TaxID=47157 RepID=UPI00041D9211|nr:phosphoadenosine phosphosulfate reductase family protein [Maridesulfovibrio bastinii]